MEGGGSVGKSRLQIREERERREELALKIEAVLLESGCTYGDARVVLGWLSSHYESKSGNLIDEVNIREIAKEPFNTEPERVDNAKAIANVLLQRERILAKRKQQSQQCAQTD